MKRKEKERKYNVKKYFIIIICLLFCGCSPPIEQFDCSSHIPPGAIIISKRGDLSAFGKNIWVTFEIEDGHYKRTFLMHLSGVGSSETESLVLLSSENIEK